MNCRSATGWLRNTCVHSAQAAFPRGLQIRFEQQYVRDLEIEATGAGT